MTEPAETAPRRPAWAHTGGYLSLRGPQPVTDDIHTLADREYAKDTALRYSYAYDERRIEVLRELFTPEARFSISIAGSGDLTVVGREAIISWLGDIMHSQADQRRHLVSNVIVEEITPASAVVVTYLAVYSVDDTATLATTGFYRFELVRQSGIWRIDHILDGLDLPF